MALLPILGELGLVLYDLEIARGTGRISVTVDRDGGVGVPGKGVTIEETAQVTRKFLYLLETTDLVSFAWSLEVSSPGIERSLRSLRHFEYALGQRCRVVLAEPVEGQIVLDGIVQSVSADGEVEIQVGGRAQVTPEMHGRQTHRAVVSGVDRVIDAASNTFRVRLELRNPDGKLPPGLRCKADLIAQPAAADAAPRPGDKGARPALQGTVRKPSAESAAAPLTAAAR
jgi:ribosome maturation factor RimP